MTMVNAAVIPNIPFFFCVWRSWSHYRGLFAFDFPVILPPDDEYFLLLAAFKASQYLDTLLEHNVIVPEESQPLDSVYTQHAPQSDSDLDSETPEKGTRTPKNGEQQHILLLTRDAVPAITHFFSLRSAAEADLYRAVEQARLRVESKRIDL